MSKLKSVFLALTLVAASVLGMPQGDAATLTANQIYKLNRMNPVFRDIQLGTYLDGLESGANLDAGSCTTTTILDGTIANVDVSASAAIAFSKLAALSRGHVLIGNSSNVAAAVDANDSGKILVGDGTDLASVAVSGDIALAANGAVTIQDASVAFDDLAALSRGHVLVGNASNVAAAVDANDSGKILVGDGTDLASVAVSGDVSLASNGAVEIAAGAIVDADVSSTAAIAGSKLASTINAVCVTGATCTETASANAGALSVSIFRSEISSAGPESRTLAAPASDGLLKLAIMTVDGGDVTLLGTNVWTAEAQTCTFNDVGDSMLLFSAGGKWLILKLNGMSCA